MSLAYMFRGRKAAPRFLARALAAVGVVATVATTVSAQTAIIDVETDETTLPSLPDYHAPAAVPNNPLALDNAFNTVAAGFDLVFDNTANSVLKQTGVAFSTTDGGFEFIELAQSVNFRRDNNALISGNEHIIWYDYGSRTLNDGTPDVYNIDSSRIGRMEAALLTANLSTGTDNLFQNDSSGVNRNNIERVDYLFSQVLQAQNSEQLGFGFSLFERARNGSADPFKIAAIRSIDSNGEPSAYYDTLLSVGSGAWGITDRLNFPTLVMNGNPDLSTEFRPSDATSNRQDLAGVLISLSDLGLGVGDNFIGYSLFGNDVTLATTGTTADLIDWTVDAVFPETTDHSNGGLDLVSGGLFFKPAGADDTGFKTGIPVPFGVDPGFGLAFLVVGAVLEVRRKRRKLHQDRAAAA